MGDLGKFQAAVERSADSLMRELAKKAEKHADALTRATINGTPLGKYNGGSTKGQIKSFVEVNGDTLTGGVKSDYPNAIYQEFGTGPVGEAGGYPGDVPGIAYVTEGWSWYSGEEGQQIKADLHGGAKEDYCLVLSAAGGTTKSEITLSRGSLKLVGQSLLVLDTQELQINANTITDGNGGADIYTISASGVVTGGTIRVVEKLGWCLVHGGITLSEATSDWITVLNAEQVPGTQHGEAIFKTIPYWSTSYGRPLRVSVMAAGGLRIRYGSKGEFQFDFCYPIN